MGKVKETLPRLDTAIIILAVGLFAGIVLRVYAWVGGEGINTLSTSMDSVMYDAMARNLLSGHGYTGIDHMIARAGQPTAFYGPAYPFYLVAIYAVTGFSIEAVQFSQMLLALGSALLIYVLGARLLGRIEGAIGASLFFTFHSITYYNFKLISETLYIALELLLVLAMVAVLQRRQLSIKLLAITGVIFGITYLCRQVIFVAPLVFLPLLWLHFNGHSVKERSRGVGAFAVCALLVVSPWAIRNYVVFDKVMMGTTTGSVTLWWGTSAYKGASIDELLYRQWAKHPDFTEIEMSRLLSEEAALNIRRMSLREYMLRAGRRTAFLLGFPRYPKLWGLQTMTGIAGTLLTTLGLLGLFSSTWGRHDRLFVALFVAAGLGLYVLTHAVFRYLMPSVPFLALGFGSVLVRSLTQVKRPSIR